MSLAANRAIYEKILHHMADGVISLDLDGRVVTFNPAAARLPSRERRGQRVSASMTLAARLQSRRRPHPERPGLLSEY